MRVGNRKKPKRKASLILTADWHLRDTRPKCRIDDYWEVQWKKLQFIHELQDKHGGRSCPVLIAGDVFHVSKSSLRCVKEALDIFPFATVCIPGQHDLPSHSLDNYEYSALHVMETIGCEVFIGKENPLSLPDDIEVTGFPWGTQLQNTNKQKNIKKVAMIHKLIQEPGEREENSSIPYDMRHSDVFKTLSNFDLIVSGDNHKPFVCKDRNGTLLVNPGSIMRMNADEIDYRPRVYLWFAEDNSVEPVFLPIEKNVISREHIEKQEKEDERMEAYKARLKAGVKIGISFEKNMSNYLRKNKIEKPIEKEIYAAMERDKA